MVFSPLRYENDLILRGISYSVLLNWIRRISLPEHTATTLS